MEEKKGKKAKFDLDVNPVETDPHLRIRQMSLDLSSPSHIPLSVRIAEFCEDPQNKDEMTAFVDDILKKAQIEVDARLEQKNKTEMKKNGKDAVNALKTGVFPDDDKPLKCYTLCVIEMGGVLSKKKEFVESKMETQARVVLPPELQEFALKGWDSCRAVPLSLINGFKRGRMVTRAQTVIVRMFEAICNCTTQTAATLPGRVSTRSQSVSK